MKIKMIRDFGVFKKDAIFEVTLEKSIELLTGGFCVRVKQDKAVFSEENLCVDLKPKKQKHKKEVISDVL